MKLKMSSVVVVALASGLLTGRKPNSTFTALIVLLAITVATFPSEARAQAPHGAGTLVCPKGQELRDNRCQAPTGANAPTGAAVIPRGTTALLASIYIVGIVPAAPTEGQVFDIEYAIHNWGIGGTLTGTVTGEFQMQQLFAPGGNSPPQVTVPPNTTISGVLRVRAPKQGSGTATLAVRGPQSCTTMPGPSGQPHSVCTSESYAQTAQDIAVAQNLSALDRDNDGIPDALEDAMLARYRPYYRFSTHKGSQEEPERPADPIWYIRHSALLTDGDQDSTPVVTNDALRNDPMTIFTIANGVSSSFSATRCNETFFLNPDNDFRSGFNNGDGTDWPQIVAQGGIGLYGHVAKDPDDPNTYRVEYWQFYGYNEADQAYVANHEGDWEGITVLVGAADPLNHPDSVIHYVHGSPIRFSNVGAALSTPGLADYSLEDIGPHFILHGPNFGYRYSDNLDAHDGNDLQKMQNAILELYCEADSVANTCTHPVVYVEWGTHASWPTPHWSFIAAPEHNGQGAFRYLTAPPPNLGEDWQPRGTTPGAEIILNYNGHWGAFSRSLPGILDTSPPHGPAVHNIWTRPNAGRPPKSCLE